MKLDEHEIKDLVAETERERAQWAKAAEVWEEDWRLWRYTDSPETTKELDGVSTLVSPDPFNIIQLLMRFVADEVRVEIPSISDKDDDEDRAEVMEEFAVAFETESGRQQGRNLINDKTWYSGVRGRGASQVLWMADVLEEKGVTGQLPILKRNLDPFNTGMGRGPYWVDYGYHTYKTSRAYIEQAYPKFKFRDTKGDGVRQGYYKEQYRVIDFYSMHQGSIWHSVQIDDQFVKRPVKTDYPYVPIIEWYADGAPIKDELARSLSILHPIHELWKLKCNLMSSVATGMDYHYHPLIIAKGFPKDERVNVGPGEVAYLPNPDQSLDAFRPEPNVPMAEKLLGMIQTGIDQATFPGVTMGDAASGSSGYAINSLAQAARSRANIIRSNIEAAMEAEYQLIFAMIETFAPDEGVQVYGRSSRGDRGKPIHLTKKIIKGNYANRIMLVPEQPMDDNARIMAWLQMVEKNIVSEGLMRNRVLNIATPRDEETRIALQNALKQPQMQLKVQLRALQNSYPQDEWERMIQGTELQPVWEAEQQWVEQKEAEEEAAKEARRQEKMQRQMEEQQAAMMAAQTGQTSQLMGPPPPSAQMPPPPLPPEMMGMPPQGMPPGFDPSMMQQGMPGIPPGAMPPPSMAPSDMGMGAQPPGLPGVPPEMAGQLSPEQLGIPPQGGPPGMFQQLMGQPPLSDEEMMQRLGGTPPPMM